MEIQAGSRPKKVKTDIVLDCLVGWFNRPLEYSSSSSTLVCRTVFEHVTNTSIWKSGTLRAGSSLSYARERRRTKRSGDKESGEKARACAPPTWASSQARRVGYKYLDSTILFPCIDFMFKLTVWLGIDWAREIFPRLVWLRVRCTFLGSNFNWLTAVCYWRLWWL